MIEVIYGYVIGKLFSNSRKKRLLACFQWLSYDLTWLDHCILNCNLSSVSVRDMMEYLGFIVSYDDEQDRWDFLTVLKLCCYSLFLHYSTTHCSTSCLTALSVKFNPSRIPPLGFSLELDEGLFARWIFLLPSNYLLLLTPLLLLLLVVCV